MQSPKIDRRMTTDPEHRNDEELRDLLTLAYEIQASYNAARRRLAVYRVAGLVMAVLVIGASITVLAAADSGVALAAATSLLGGYVVVLVGVELALVRPLRWEIRSQDRALHEVVNLLRELERYIADDHGWSTYQRAELRTRLALFPL